MKKILKMSFHGQRGITSITVNPYAIIDRTDRYGGGKLFEEALDTIPVLELNYNAMESIFVQAVNEIGLDPEIEANYEIEIHTEFCAGLGPSSSLKLTYNQYNSSYETVKKENAISFFPFLDENDNVFAMILDHFEKEDLYDRLKNISNTYNKRKSNSKKYGDTIRIDFIAARMIEIAKKHDPKIGEKILKKGKCKVKVKAEDISVFCKGKADSKDQVTLLFNASEGVIKVTFDLNEEIKWAKTRMFVPPMPSVVMASLVGGPAREVIDHPIADLLGTVARAYPGPSYKKGTWLTFKPLIQKVSKASL